VWDVQRLVTGLLGTPAFVRGAHNAGTLDAAHGGDTKAAGTTSKHGHGHGHGHSGHSGGGITMRRRLEETPPRLGGGGGGGDCDCGGGTGLIVHNPDTCAPTAEYVFRLNPDRWPAGYPAKGRLVHWATPCDYSAAK
jgi:hypothetical protein